MSTEDAIFPPPRERLLGETLFGYTRRKFLWKVCASDKCGFSCSYSSFYAFVEF